jgi:oligopeptide/dipeptide ABC transporter ATP-binding protein
MYAGRIVEVGDADQVFAAPVHPYTKGLIRATPRLDVVTERMVSIDGVPPDLISPPRGCAFFPRCDQAGTECSRMQALIELGDDRHVSCWCAAKEAVR